VILNKYFKRLIRSFISTEPRARRILFGALRGIYYTIDPQENLGDVFGILKEPHLQHLLVRYVRPGGVVFDIGANLGFFTLLMSRLVGERGNVYAFEPYPSAAEMLRKHLQLNHMTNVRVVEKGVSDKAGNTVLRVPDYGKNHSMASICWHKQDATAVENKVEMLAIDESDEFKNCNPVFIKVDVEGAEGLAMRGMEKLLERARPVIYIECSDAGRRQSWETLQRLGYGCFDVERQHVKIVNFTDYRHSNYVWMPS